MSHLLLLALLLLPYVYWPCFMIPDIRARKSMPSTDGSSNHHISKPTYMFIIFIILCPWICKRFQLKVISSNSKTITCISKTINTLTKCNWTKCTKAVLQYTIILWTKRKYQGNVFIDYLWVGYQLIIKNPLFDFS